MKWELALLTLCAFASAMVPRERRAVDSEELLATTGGASDDASTTAKPAGSVKICAENTPCGWLFYNQNKVIELSVNNTYCHCDKNLNCGPDEDDKANFMFVKKCREPGKSLVIDLES